MSVKSSSCVFKEVPVKGSFDKDDWGVRDAVPVRPECVWRVGGSAVEHGTDQKYQGDRTILLQCRSERASL